MEALQKRLEALEQQTEHLQHRTQAIERHLRWWRRIALGLLMLHWYEKDRKAQAARASAATAPTSTTPERVREPANV